MLCGASIGRVELNKCGNFFKIRPTSATTVASSSVSKECYSIDELARRQNGPIQKQSEKLLEDYFLNPPPLLSKRYGGAGDLSGTLRKHKKSDNSEGTGKWIIFKSSDTDAGMRFESWLKKQFPSIPRSAIKTLQKKIFMKNECEDSWRSVGGLEHRVVENAMFRIRRIDLNRTLFKRIKGYPWVLYADEHLVLVNRDGLDATKRSSKKSSTAMIKSLSFEGKEAPVFVGITEGQASGVSVLARNEQVAKKLRESFGKREFRAMYWAICAGVPSKLAGSIKVNSCTGDNLGVGVRKTTIYTKYNTLHHISRVASILALKPVTFVKNQLKNYCERALGTPIICPNTSHDAVEAFFDGDLSSFYLHCRELVIAHPVTGKPLHITAEPPSTFLRVSRKIVADSELKNHPAAVLKLDERVLKPYKFCFTENAAQRKQRLGKMKVRRRCLGQQLKTAHKSVRATIGKLRSNVSQNRISRNIKKKLFRAFSPRNRKRTR